MPDGGILRISAENLALDKSGDREIAAGKDVKDVMVTITDEGMGIPAKYLGRIFDPISPPNRKAAAWAGDCLLHHQKPSGDD
jgi:signal transduction histidine kinase